jgi:hypothetical protein
MISAMRRWIPMLVLLTSCGRLGFSGSDAESDAATTIDAAVDLDASLDAPPVEADAAPVEVAVVAPLPLSEFAGVFPEIVWAGGDVFGVAWSDLRFGAFEQFFVRLEEGALSGELRLSNDESWHSWQPGLSWTGIGYQLAWNHRGTSPGIYVTDVSAEGSVIGERLIPGTNNRSYQPVIVRGAIDQLVWIVGDTTATRQALSGAYVLTDSPVPMGSANYFVDLRVVTAGDTLATTFGTTTAAHVDFSGTSVGAFDFAGTVAATEADVASVGGSFVAVWLRDEGAGFEIWSQAFTPEGAVVSASVAQQLVGPGNLRAPRIAPWGDAYAVVYANADAGGIYLLEVDGAGAASAEPRRLLETTEVAYLDVAPAATSLGMAWTQDVGGAQRVHVAVVR